MTRSTPSGCRPTVFGPILLVLAPLLLAGTWPMDGGDPGGTRRATGPAAIDGETQLPGFVLAVQGRPRTVQEAWPGDFGGEGAPEILVVDRGAITAFDPTLGGVLWSSPAGGLDAIVGFADLDGDGAAVELIASSGAVGGGLSILDGRFGGLLGGVGGLPERSGVSAAEITLYDLDGDGRSEAIFPAGQYGLGTVYVASFPAGPTAPVLLEQSFAGYNNLTPAHAGRLMPGGGAGVVVDQGPVWSAFAVCEPGDDGAACDDGAGSLCLCDRGSFAGVHPTYAFGQARVIDADGDGDDEVLQVASSPLYTRSLSLLDFGEGLAAGSPDTAALVRWYRHYTSADPVARVVLPEQPLPDLDGDGLPDLLVCFLGNDGGDTDHAGLPDDDGIDHGAGLSVGVFDPATGALRAMLLDRFVFGTADLDGDGALEVVSGPTDGWSFQPGLSGHELVCGGPSDCALEPAWQLDGVSLAQDLESLAGTGLPHARLFSLQGQDGAEHLLAYQDGDLALVGLDDAGAVQVVAAATLLQDEQLIAADGGLGLAVVAGEGTLRGLDDQLQQIGVVIPVPGSGVGPLFAVGLADGEPARLVHDGFVFASEQAPTSPEDADLELLPGFGLAVDLDGDGADEILSYRNPSHGGGADFELALLAWDGVGFAPGWTFDAAGVPELEGYQVTGGVHMGSGDFDGEGADDLAVVARSGGSVWLLVLDGDTGALDALIPSAVWPATGTRLLVEDLSDPDGLGPDGLADVLVHGNSWMDLHSGGEGATWHQQLGFYHHVSAHGDLDGDGGTDLVGTKSATIVNEIEAWTGLEAPVVAWGPQALGRPSGSLEVLALAPLDDVAGLDVAYATGDGSLELYAGLDGAPLAGFPVWLAAGQLHPDSVVDAPVLRALLAIDVDDDGYDELVVGSGDGWLYAVDVSVEDPAAPGLAWAMEVGASVERIGAADLDGDGYEELLLATDDRRALVVDGVGVELVIESPKADDCIASTLVEVSGTAVGVARVDLFGAGGAGSQGVDASGGTWSGTVWLLGPGLHEIRVEGQSEEGVLVAVATVSVVSEGDADGDGATLCGGDCDDGDAGRFPGNVEVCEDGVDQDCDGADGECGEAVESGGDDDDDGGGGCGCGVGDGGVGSWLMVVLFGLGWRGRREAP